AALELACLDPVRNVCGAVAAQFAYFEQVLAGVSELIRQRSVPRQIRITLGESFAIGVLDREHKIAGRTQRTCVALENQLPIVSCAEPKVIAVARNVDFPVQNARNKEMLRLG